MRRKENSADTIKQAVDQSEVFSSLAENRILFLTGEITGDNANALCAQMMMLSLQDRTKDITLVINSEGGNVTDTMAIYDVMRAIECDVTTICIGEAASGAAVILGAGAKGKRFALPHSRIMIHQPQGGAEGSSRDVAIEAQELLRLREMLTSILATHTGIGHEKLHHILERDTYLTAEAAREIELIDRVIDRLPF